MWVWGKFASFFSSLDLLSRTSWFPVHIIHSWCSLMFSLQVQNVTAAYIMKCDDDTFIRVDTVLKEIRGVSPNRSLYMGNLNLLHRPLRTGKWAVSFQVHMWFSLIWNQDVVFEYHANLSQYIYIYIIVCMTITFVNEHVM